MTAKWTDVVTGMDPVTTHEHGFDITSFAMGGAPHRNGVAAAVAACYRDLTGRLTLTSERLLPLLGTKVSLLRRLDGAFGHTAVQTLAGTLERGTTGPMIVPKGSRTRGFALGPLVAGGALLDLEPGYAGERVLVDRVERVRACLPEVVPLTQDHLTALGTGGDRIRLAVFGTYPFPTGPIPGALWLLSDYMPEDDIASGVLIVPPGTAESEHGSVYGGQLLRMNVGVVANFAPISFAEALALTGAEYAEVLSLLTAGAIGPELHAALAA